MHAPFPEEHITLIHIVEALIFASPNPINAEEICKTLVAEDDSLEIQPTEIEGIVHKLNSDYSDGGRSFRIEHTGGGYTFSTFEVFHPWLQSIQHENANRKLSQSAVETLAIVAYRQPITKPEVDQVRGVDSAYILKQLLEKKLVMVAGRKDSPGKPLLYRTTTVFLRHFGINSVEELPKPREIDEILKDDDMAEHRQLLLELKAELGADRPAADGGQDPAPPTDTTAGSGASPDNDPEGGSPSLPGKDETHEKD